MSVSRFLDGIGYTSRRLALCILVATAVCLIGWKLGKAPLLRTTPVSEISYLLAGGIISLAANSWFAGNRFRARQHALRSFWHSFAEDVYIILPSDKSRMNLSGASNEASVFTPYHDALACYEIQHMLYRHLGVVPQIRTCAEVEKLDDIWEHNLVLIGGPNYNRLTELFSKRVRSSYPGRAFHWSTDYYADPRASQMIRPDEDYFVMIDRESCLAIDEMGDIYQPNSAMPLHVRGMVVKAEGLIREDKAVVLLAGADCAFGTLAATRYALNARGLEDLVEGQVIQVIASAPVIGSRVGPVQALRTMQIG